MKKGYEIIHLKIQVGFLCKTCSVRPVPQKTDVSLSNFCKNAERTKIKLLSSKTDFLLVF